MMRNSKLSLIAAFLVLVVIASGFTAVYWRGEDVGQTMVATTDDSGYDGVFSPTRYDMNTDVSDAMDITRDSEGNASVITEGGTYRLSGRFNHTIEVDAEDQIVRLELDNAVISTSDGPAIYVRSAGKVFITIPEGTESELSDSAFYSDITPSGAIYSESDLTINGYGTLAITGYRKDAIHTEGELRLLGVSMSLRAKRCGIKANDGMLLMPLVLSIESEGDGLVTSKPGQEQKGTLEVAAGQVSIIAGDTSIRSAKDLFISNCHVDMKSVVEDINTAGETYIEEGCI